MEKEIEIYQLLIGAGHKRIDNKLDRLSILYKKINLIDRTLKNPYMPPKNSEKEICEIEKMGLKEKIKSFTEEIKKEKINIFNCQNRINRYFSSI